MPSQELIKHGLQELVDAVLDEAIAEKRIVGAVVLVSLGGRRVYERAAGFADREARTPARPHTIFRWASLTKAVVATATLALVERQLISLDDPVTRFLPDFRPRLPDGDAPVITVRHLMTHTAGLTYRMFEPGDGPYHRANVSDGMDQPGLSIEENLQRIASVPLSRAPGSGWGYSVGADVLGECIARAAQTSLPILVKKLVTVLTAQSIDRLGTIEPGDFEPFMPGWKWPLGWAVLESPAETGTPQSPGTWQWGGVYGCSWFVDPARKLSAVILTNTAVSGMLGPFPDAVRDAIYASIQP